MDPSVRDLRICIIGAGMGGLSAALALAKKGFSNISVYETAPNLGFVGAGIQLAPNMARILDRLGVWEKIEREAVILYDTSIREGPTDKELGHVDLHYIKPTYGYHHMVGHRASLAGGLFEGCQREPAIQFHFNTRFEGIESWSPKPTIRLRPVSPDDNDTNSATSPPFTLTADVLLASDGIKSVARAALLHELNHDAKVVDTGQAAYRIMLTREQMGDDAELLELLDADRVTRWIAQKRHIIAYPIASKSIYNLSTVQPDVNFASAPGAEWTTHGSKAAMLRVFGDFCPRVQRMLHLVPEEHVVEWRLCVHAPLPTWVRGGVALLGDACHPTLPHLAQGAAQAIEDAAVVAEVLARLPDVGAASVRAALRVYEAVRMERAYALVELAAASGRALHLGDGAAKEERDKQFAALKAGKGPVPDKWADRDVQRTVYEVDVGKIAGEVFAERFDEFMKD